MFATLPDRNFNFCGRITLLSANALNMDKSKILSSGKQLIRVAPLPSFAGLQSSIQNGLQIERQDYAPSCNTDYSHLPRQLAQKVVRHHMTLSSHDRNSFLFKNGVRF